MVITPNRSVLRRVAVAVVCVVGAVLIRWGISAVYDANVGLAPFVVAVAVATWYGGLWPGLIATALGAVAVASAVPHPAGLLVLANHNLPRIAMFFVAGWSVSWCIELLHRQVRQLLAINHAKDQFLSMLSHELRNPLAPIVAATDAMRQDSTIATRAGDQLDMIDRNVQLEVRLIDDLLDMSRLRVGKLSLQREVIELADVLHAAIETCDRAVRDKRLRLSISVSDGPHHVHGDAARLEQVFWNLLRNAVKFTPEEGEISVSLRTATRGRHMVTITDSGIGIERSQLPKIFEPFEQGAGVPGRFGGLGLGLAIAKRLLDLHGGRITAASEGIGTGTTMTVVLPASYFPLTPPAPVPSRTCARMGALRILLVEDHSDTAAAMGRLLRHMGHSVSVASTVATALAAAKQGPFDLVLSDIGLPDGTGYDLVPRLREIQPVPCIALTGHGMPEEILRAMHAGFVMHLTKPVGVAQLQKAITHVASTLAIRSPANDIVSR